MGTKRFEALDGINTVGPTTVANTLTISSNVAVDTNVLFVDTVTDRVGIKKAPTQGALDVSGNVHATAFIGDGSGLTGLSIPTNVLVDNANNTYINGRFTISTNAHVVFTSNSFLQFSDGRPINFGTGASVVAQGNTSGLFFTGSNVVINTTTFYLDSTNGRVGIGNTAPTEALHVQGKIRIGTQATATTDAVRADRSLTAGNGLSGGGDLTADRSFAVDSTVVRTSGNQTIAGIKTFSNTISGSINGNANTVTNGVYTTGNQTIAGIKTFSNTISGSINGNANTVTNGVYTTGNQTIAGVKTFSDNVRIDSLGVGTTASGVSGEIRATGNITGYFSDERLKTKIQIIENALNKVNNINGIYFELNDLAKSFGYTETQQQVGVLAQQVQKVLPHVVTNAPFDIQNDHNGNTVSKSGENYLTVNYEKLVPLLIEAIKELSLKVEMLEGKIK
jgi:hypothetical protein